MWTAVSRLISVTILTIVLVTLQGCGTLDLGADDIDQEFQVLENLKQGENFYQQGKYEEAKEYFDKVIAADNDNESAHYRLGNIYFKLGNYQRALEYFNSAADLNPRNERAHYNLATLHLMLAERRLQFYTATAPDSADLSRVSKLLGHLREYSNSNHKSGQSTLESTKLERLVNLLEQ